MPHLSANVFEFIPRLPGELREHLGERLVGGVQCDRRRLRRALGELVLELLADAGDCVAFCGVSTVLERRQVVEDLWPKPDQLFLDFVPFIQLRRVELSDKMLDLCLEIVFWLGVVAARAAGTGRHEHDRDKNSAHKSVPGPGNERRGHIRGNTRNSRR